MASMSTTIERGCWADVGRGQICGGVAVWAKINGEWRSKCGKCCATGLAASGERRQLDAEESRTA
jgi:hypothetical protein